MGQGKFKRWGAGNVPGLAVVLAACSLMGCAKDDDSAGSGGACIPNTVLTSDGAPIAGQARILGFAVDEEHAYWLAWEAPRSHASPYTIHSGPAATVLRTCELERCEKTLQSTEVSRSTDPSKFDWAEMSMSTDSNWGKRLALSKKRVFWLSEVSGVHDGSGIAIATGIEYCAKTDCSKLKHYAVGDATVDDFLVDGDKLVMATNEGTLLTCNESDCDNTIERFPLDVPVGASLDSGVRQMVADVDFYYLAKEERLLRVRKDGSQPFEILAQDVGSIGELAVSGDNLYFARRFPPALLSCPKTGCVGEPTAVVMQLHAPYGLIVEKDTFYISEPADVPLDFYTLPEANVGDDRLLRCSGSACTTIMAGNTGLLGPMTANSHDIYFSTWQGFDGCDDYFSIQRVAKDAPEAQ